MIKSVFTSKDQSMFGSTILFSFLCAIDDLSPFEKVLFLSKFCVMHLYPDWSFSQQGNALLKCIGLSELHMCFHALPAKGAYERFPSLSLFKFFILDILDDPTSGCRLKSLGLLIQHGEELLHSSFMIGIMSSEVRSDDFCDGTGCGRDRARRWMRFEVGVVHGERPINNGHEMLRKRAIYRGLDEVLMTVIGVPICGARRLISNDFGQVAGRLGKHVL